MTVPGTSGFSSGAYAGSGGELTVVNMENDRYWPEENGSLYFTVLRTRSGGASLTATQPEVLARLRWDEIGLSRIVLLDKRTLVIGTDKNGILYTTGVWLPN